MSILVAYASKYGSTEEYARKLAEILGASCLSVEDTGGEEIEGTELAVIGSPVYGPSVLPSMETFLGRHRHRLMKMKLAAFVVCGDTDWLPSSGEGGQVNLRKLTTLLPRSAEAEAVFPGRLNIGGLDGEDLPRILAFYRRLGKEATGFDLVDLKAVEPFAVRIRNL